MYLLQFEVRPQIINLVLLLLNLVLISLYALLFVLDLLSQQSQFRVQLIIFYF